MNKCFLSVICFLFIALGVTAKSALEWGDQADGTFINPVLNADYSDPDVIRVGDKYYLTCSEFHFMGMPILESDDLLHWRIIARIYDSLPGYDNMDKYAQGTWAPAIRYHDGLFYIYVCTPHEGLWVTTASDPAGPWQPMQLIHAADRWEDPCPFWDEDGNAYLGRSQWGAGPIIVHRMSPDGMALLDDGVVVYEGPVAEGTKFYAKDGYVYLSIPEGGVHGGWQTVLRANDIYGPYEGVRTLEQGSTAVNGPHQGAIVDTPDGEWWFVHFQETPVLGRVMHLQPVRWVDGFPQMGYDFDGNGVGEPMYVAANPSGASATMMLPSTDDCFDSDTLSIIWQFNHNPDLSAYDLKSRPGWLTWRSLPADSLHNAHNTLTQKMMGYEGDVVTCLDIAKMAEGQRAGLISMGKFGYAGGVMIKHSKPYAYVEHGGEIIADEPLDTIAETIYLRYHYDAKANDHQFYRGTSANDISIPVGPLFHQRWGHWKGCRIGLYNYTTDTPGEVQIDEFRVHIQK